MVREDKPSLIKDNRSSKGSTNEITIDIDDELLTDNQNVTHYSFIPEAVNFTYSAEQVQVLTPIKEPVLIKETLSSESRCSSSRPENFDIGIRVIEATQLPGLDINPLVRLVVGNRKKSTTIQRSTNSPFWNQYFVISFNKPRLQIFQKVISITVVDYRGLLKSDDIIGSFSCDIGTVFSQPGHSFQKKWAVLVDPETKELRGYLNLDITVLFKEDSSTGTVYDADEDELEIVTKETNESDIESNLLLPFGVKERQPIKLVIKIYRAYGLTRTESSIKKALNLGSSSTCDAYVSVSFAGSTQRTSTIKKSSSPVWNQQFTFVELFPTFFQNIKFEVKDEELGIDGLLATHYLPLNYIASDGQDGYLPTFGPTFINLYGASRESSSSDSKVLSTGLEEGVAYVGRILISITTEFSTSDPEKISIKNIRSLDEIILGPRKEFALFGLINSVSGINSRFADKNISVELNMGDPEDLDGDGNIDEEDKKARVNYRGVTVAHKAVECFSNSPKEIAFHLPLDSQKPIMFHRFSWIDDTWRLFVANRLIKISRNLATGLADVDALIVTREYDAACRLLGVLDQFIEDCSSFLQYLFSLSDPPGVTTLDQQKMKQQCEMIKKLSEEAWLARDSLATVNIVPITQALSPWINELNGLSASLHITFPDVFLSMLADGERVAQTRLPTRDIVYSPDPKSKGIYTGKFRSLLLRTAGQPNGQIRAQINILCWFGVADQLPNVVYHLPIGYAPDSSLESLHRPDSYPPTHLNYLERSIFQSRAHIFQARSLIGADKSGLSDPYVKIYFDKCILVSQTKKKTLSPCWDQLIMGPQISLIGSRDDIKSNCLTALVEVYDRDMIGGDDFIGQSKVTFDYVRFADEIYKYPRLNWYDVWLNGHEGGQLLMALELVQLSETDSTTDYPRSLSEYVSVVGNTEIISIPPQIRPTLSKYKLQVIFWGVRNLKRVKLLSVDKPKAIIEVGATIISSSVIPNYSKNPNFPNFRKEIELSLPDQEFYCPPLSINVGDCRAFGRFTLVGSHVIRSLARYIQDKQVDIKNLPKRHIIIDLDHLKTQFQSPWNQSEAIITPRKGKIESKVVYGSFETEKRIKMESSEEEIDWWMRYFASKDSNIQNKAIPNHLRLRIYPDELEHRFNDVGVNGKLTAFPLKRGRFEDETSNLNNKGIFKGAFRLCRYPWKNRCQLVEHLTNNDPIKVLVRVYIVRAYDVVPRNANGKADLYPIIKLGSKNINDFDKFVTNSLDPIFGRLYEFEATFPHESTLTITLKDHDVFSSDQLIGRTKIDLEDRFYSIHRASCGLSRSYQISGPGKWRESLEPSQILSRLSRDLKINNLVIANKYIKIGKMLFTRKQDDQKDSNNIPHEGEQLALGVLNSWKEIFGYKLVPEHIETRSLYRSDKPGVAQGKLEMWIDMFRAGDPRPEPIDISPRCPKSYELRVTIWNTKDVILDEESMISGEKMSDIYIKGWIQNPKLSQSTDVHYRSFTGEGNFNWRFLFRFDFLHAEGVIIARHRDHFYSLNPTQVKLPCRLSLQVWNYSSSGDHLLGCLPLNLLEFPRGSRTARDCNLGNLLNLKETKLQKDLKNARINLFKEKRVRGWWPFYAKLPDGKDELTGKMEAEFELLTREEADVNPVGLGREAPHPLDKPQ